MTDDTKRSWRAWLDRRFGNREATPGPLPRPPDGPILPGGSVMTQPGPLPGSAPGSVSEHMHEYLTDGPLPDEMIERSVAQSVEDRCPDCGGSGLIVSQPDAGLLLARECPACKGLGRRITRHYRP